MKQILIYYYGLTQFKNSGDLLINKILLSLLVDRGILLIEDRILPEAYKINLLQGIQHKLLSNVTNKSFFLHLLLKSSVNFITKKYDIYVIEPPGHLYEVRKKPTYRNHLRWIFNFFLYISGCKRIRLGVSLGPYTKEFVRYNARMSKLYYAIGVRDNESLIYAKDNNFFNVRFIPDLAWSKILSPTRCSIELPKKSYTLLSFRDCIIKDTRDDVYFEKLLRAIDLALPVVNDNVVLFYQTAYDRKTCIELLERYRTNYSIDFIDKCLNPEEAGKLISKANTVITNRLHILIPSINQSVLTIALTDVEKHGKLRSIVADNNLNECLIDFNDSISERIKLVNEQKEQIIQKFNQVSEEKNLEINKIVDEVFPKQF